MRVVNSNSSTISLISSEAGSGTTATIGGRQIVTVPAGQTGLGGAKGPVQITITPANRGNISTITLPSGITRVAKPMVVGSSSANGGTQVVSLGGMGTAQVLAVNPSPSTVTTSASGATSATDDVPQLDGTVENDSLEETVIVDGSEYFINEANTCTNYTWDTDFDSNNTYIFPDADDHHYSINNKKYLNYSDCEEDFEVPQFDGNGEDGTEEKSENSVLDSQSESPSENPTETQPEAQPENQPESQPENQPESQPEGQPSENELLAAPEPMAEGSENSEKVGASEADMEQQALEALAQAGAMLEDQSVMDNLEGVLSQQAALDTDNQEAAAAQAVLDAASQAVLDAANQEATAQAALTAANQQAAIDAANQAAVLSDTAQALSELAQQASDLEDIKPDIGLDNADSGETPMDTDLEPKPELPDAGSGEYLFLISKSRYKSQRYYEYDTLSIKYNVCK